MSTLPFLKVNLVQYWATAYAVRRQGWGRVPFWELVRSYPRWRSNLGGNGNPLGGASPWMTFAAVRFLNKLLTKEMRVFEYGSGGSSLFFAHHAREVVSVEHDASWAERVNQMVQEKGLRNVSVHFVWPEADAKASQQDPADPEGYVSSDQRYQGYSFKRYASSIDGYPTGFFDVVVIDGRARPSCFKHALGKVAVGGWLVLDNAERAEYRRIHGELESKHWKKFEFSGPGPHTPLFWQTCFWQRLV